MLTSDVRWRSIIYGFELFSVGLGIIIDIQPQALSSAKWIAVSASPVQSPMQVGVPFFSLELRKSRQLALGLDSQRDG